MTNAWALAASILDGTFDEDYPVMKKEDTTITPQESDEYDIPKKKDTDRITYSTDFKHSPSWYDYTRNDPDAKNPFTDAFDHMMAESVVNGYPYPQSYLADNDDNASHHFTDLHIQATSPYNDGYTQDFYKEELKKMSDSRNKYHENEILKDVEEYVSRTYNGHYTGTKHEYRNVQTIDLMASRDLASDFCQANILKYGSRYGSKDGRNKKDLLKVIHYAMLLLHFDEHYGKPSMTSGNIDHNMP